MFIQLDLTLQFQERFRRLVNMSLVQEVIINQKKLILFFGIGDEDNNISFDITPETEEFFKILYEKITLNLIWGHQGSNVIEMKM